MLQLNHVNFDMDTHHHHSMYFLTILGSTSKYMEVFPTGNVEIQFVAHIPPGKEMKIELSNFEGSWSNETWCQIQGTHVRWRTQ